jgi:hypothetical protein
VTVALELTAGLDDFHNSRRTISSVVWRLFLFVRCDHVAAAPVASCSAVKAELMPTAPAGVCLLVGD